MFGNITPGTEAAKACFQENIRLFASAQSQPEKYNLYNGLQNLAIAIEKIEIRLENLESEIRNRS